MTTGPRQPAPPPRGVDRAGPPHVSPATSTPRVARSPARWVHIATRPDGAGPTSQIGAPPEPGGHPAASRECGGRGCSGSPYRDETRRDETRRDDPRHLLVSWSWTAGRGVGPHAFRRGARWHRGRRDWTEREGSKCRAELRERNRLSMSGAGEIPMPSGAQRVDHGRSDGSPRRPRGSGSPPPSGRSSWPGCPCRRRPAAPRSRSGGVRAAASEPASRGRVAVGGGRRRAGTVSPVRHRHRWSAPGNRSRPRCSHPQSQTRCHPAVDPSFDARVASAQAVIP